MWKDDEKCARRVRKKSIVLIKGSCIFLINKKIHVQLDWYLWSVPWSKQEFNNLISCTKHKYKNQLTNCILQHLTFGFTFQQESPIIDYVLRKFWLFIILYHSWMTRITPLTLGKIETNNSCSLDITNNNYILTIQCPLDSI